MKPHIHIIGAGFSGMTLALRLRQKGFTVRISEKESYAGGMIGTRAVGSGLCEKAAPAISRTPRVEALVKELGIPSLTPAKSSKKRYIYHPARQKFLSFPLNFFEVLVMVFKFFFNKWRGQIPPKPTESLRDWGYRVLGEGATELVVSPAMQGIYAGDAKTLSATLVLKRFFKRNKKSPDRYLGLIGFPRGMSQFIDALELKLKQNQVEIALNQNLEQLKVTPYEIQILATNPIQAGSLLKNISENVSEILSQMPMLSLLSATVNFPTDRGLKGFGGLIPKAANLQTLGVLFNNHIFDRGWSFRSETWIMGGATNEPLMDMSDKRIQSLILKEREILFGETEGISQSVINRWPKGMPNYNLKLQELLERLEPLRPGLEEQGVYLHGNYLGGIGLSQILQQSEELAERIFLKHGN